MDQIFIFAYTFIKLCRFIDPTIKWKFAVCMDYELRNPQPKPNIQMF